MDFGPLPPRVHIYIHVRAYIREHTHCTHGGKGLEKDS